MINPELGLRPESIARNEGRIVARLRVPETLAAFAGHFPGNPILPAYAIIDITLQIGGDHLLVENRVMRSAKFTRPVQPGQEVEIRIEGERAEWRLVADGQLVAELVFAARTAEIRD